MARRRRGGPLQRAPWTLANWSRPRPEPDRRSSGRRRLARWSRERRLGLWLGALLGLVVVAYALVVFIEAALRYVPSFDAASEIERLRQHERQGGSR